jgi:hypothetical protein
MEIPVASSLRLYKEDPRPTESKLCLGSWQIIESPELAIGRIIEKRWQRYIWHLQQRSILRVPEEIADRQSCTRV